jgi:hypothetical protein
LRLDRFIRGVCDLDGGHAVRRNVPFRVTRASKPPLLVRCVEHLESGGGDDDGGDECRW